MKKIIIILFSMLLFGASVQPSKAFVSTTRKHVRYEVSAVTWQDQQLTINGWGVINATQHFLGAQTHKTSLVLRSNTKTLTYAGSHTNVDLTQLFAYTGSRMCLDQEYFKESNTCNYRYQNVGFQFKIPLSDLDLDVEYTVYLRIETIQSKVKYEVPLYYPTKFPQTHQKGKVQYIAHTALNDNTLQIINSHVFVKPRPTPLRETVQYGPNCSSSYRNTLYYKENATFRSILEKTMVDQVTYYRVAGQLSSCNNLRREVVEGTQIQPMWMTSLYVDYHGDPLKIKAKWLGTPPTMTITSHPIISEGSPFYPLDYVTAYDREDGDLTDKIRILNSNYEDRAGKYTVRFYVEDSDKESSSADLQVVVTPLPNTPPSILANNKTIYQYSVFDPLQDVSANDHEDGVIQQIGVKGSVDTSVLGTYFITYTVQDSKGLSSTKTIEINVVAHPMSKYRYLDRQYPFYKQHPPLNWINHLDELQFELQNKNAYVIRIME